MKKNKEKFKISKEDLLKINRAGRRMADLERGVEYRPSVVHKTAKIDAKRNNTLRPGDYEV